MSVPKNRWTRLAAWKKAGRPKQRLGWGRKTVCERHSQMYDEQHYIDVIPNDKPGCEDCINDPLSPASLERGGL